MLMKESGKKGAKMNWKNRLTNYNFWISMFSAVLLILQALKIEFDILYVNEIFTAVLGLLVVIGIISDPTRTSVKSAEISTAKQETNVKPETKQETAETLPTDEKNEVNSFTHQNDFQILLNKIVADLDEKTAILSEKFNELKNFKEEIVSKEPKKEETNEIIKDDIKEDKEVQVPAVADLMNPYVDVIN